MNHLEATYKGKNNFWRYLVMIAAVFLASNTIGSIPLLISFLIKSMSDPQTLSGLAKTSGDLSFIGLDSNTLLAFMLFPFMAALAAFFFLVKPLHSRTFAQTINGTSKIRWNRFFTSMIIWYALSAGYFIINLKLDPGNFSVANTGMTVLILTIISIVLIPFQSGLEEVLFRGYLMQGFTSVFNRRWFPLITTSLLFALLHSLNPEVREYGFLTMMPQYFIFGIIFGIITIMDDGAEAAMGAHTANNTFLCIMVTNKSSALQTAAIYEQIKIYPWTELLVLVITGLLFILILSFVFRWKGFKVLTGRVEREIISETVN